MRAQDQPGSTGTARGSWTMSLAKETGLLVHSRNPSVGVMSYLVNLKIEEQQSTRALETLFQAPGDPRDPPGS